MPKEEEEEEEEKIKYINVQIEMPSDDFLEDYQENQQ